MRGRCPLLALGLLALAAGCAPQVALAPFSARPDTSEPGDLRGPFSGQVTDAVTGNALSGALVFATWAYEGQGAGHLPLLAQSQSAVTRPDGTYVLPKAPLITEPGALLRRFTLVVYKAGYYGYRSDFRADMRPEVSGRPDPRGPEHTPRRDFAQAGLVIKLDRFPEGESHARHLAFLGGGTELRRVAQAEYTQAALELSDQLAPQKAEPVAKEDPPLTAPEPEALLTAARLAQVTGSKLRFSAESLAAADGATPDEKDELYRGAHLVAAGKGEAFDAGLRLWRTREPTQAEARFAQLKDALAAGKAAGALGIKEIVLQGSDQALRAFDAKRRIHGVLVLLREARLVLQLSCGAGLCSKEDTAQKLMAQVLAAPELKPIADAGKEDKR